MIIDILNLYLTTKHAKYTKKTINNRFRILVCLWLLYILTYLVMFFLLSSYLPVTKKQPLVRLLLFLAYFISSSGTTDKIH